VNVGLDDVLAELMARRGTGPPTTAGDAP
jgi:hypothetical protein